MNSISNGRALPPYYPQKQMNPCRKSSLQCCYKQQVRQNICTLKRHTFESCHCSLLCPWLSIKVLNGEETAWLYCSKGRLWIQQRLSNTSRRIYSATYFNLSIKLDSSFKQRVRSSWGLSQIALYGTLLAPECFQNRRQGWARSGTNVWKFGRQEKALPCGINASHLQTNENNTRGE